MRLTALREEVAQMALRMFEQGLVEFTAGNVSAIDRASGTVAITPSGIEYDQIHRADVLIVDLDGAVLEGVHQASSETRMHCEVYRRRADVGGVVHTHSPWATSFAALAREIPPVHYAISSIGNCIRVASYATYGSAELARTAVDTLGADNAVLLQNHGVLAVGADLRGAFKNAVRVEFLAEVYWKSSLLGHPVLLSPEELDRVRARSAAKNRVTGTP